MTSTALNACPPTPPLARSRNSLLRFDDRAEASTGRSQRIVEHFSGGWGLQSLRIDAKRSKSKRGCRIQAQTKLERLKAAGSGPVSHIGITKTDVAACFHAGSVMAVRQSFAFESVFRIFVKACRFACLQKALFAPASSLHARVSVSCGAAPLWISTLVGQRRVALLGVAVAFLGPVEGSSLNHATHAASREGFVS